MPRPQDRSTPKVPSSPFFAPSTPRTLQPISTPNGTVRLVKKEPEEKEHKSTQLGTTGNLINAIVGAGIVGIPYAIRQAGLVSGVLLVILCSIITEKSLRLLIATAKHVDVPSYEMLCEASFGKVGFYFISVSMFVMAYGAMVSYLMIVKDTLPLLLGVDPEDYPMRRAVLTVSSLLIMFPLSAQRDMADLAKTSTMSVIFDIFMVILVSIYSPITTTSTFDNNQLEEYDSMSAQLSSVFQSKEISLFNPKSLFTGLGVLSFAFVCQHSALIIAGSLKNPTQKRWSQVTRNALSLCCVLACVIGICGYLGFGSATMGNILNNFSASNEMMAITTARALVCTTMFFVYPMESFVARHVTIVMLFQGRRAHEGDDHAVLARRDRRIGLTLALYMLALLPALIFENLGGVLAVTGAVGGSCLSYIGPGCVYLGVHGEEFLALVKENGWDLHEQSSPPSIMTKITYYLFGMPIWCSIARTGKDTLARFQENEAMKSPHPNRLGKVIHHPNVTNVANKMKALQIQRHKLARRDSEGEENASSMKPLIRSGSFGETQYKQQNKQLTSNYGAAAVGGGNSGIAAAIAAKNSQKEVVAVTINQEEEEEDPQDKCATSYDFCVSIGFILFGCVALCAGLVSIYFGS